MPKLSKYGTIGQVLLSKGANAPCPCLWATMLTACHVCFLCHSVIMLSIVHNRFLCEVLLEWAHNHSICNQQALQQLRVKSSTKEMAERLFAAGVGVAGVRRILEDNLEDIACLEVIIIIWKMQLYLDLLPHKCTYLNQCVHHSNFHRQVRVIICFSKVLHVFAERVILQEYYSRHSMPSDNQLEYLLQKWRKSQWGTTDNEVLIALEKRKIELLEDGNHSYIALQAYLL